MLKAPTCLHLWETDYGFYSLWCSTVLLQDAPMHRVIILACSSFLRIPLLQQKWVKNVQRTRAHGVATAVCVRNTLIAAALNLTWSWLHRWACRTVEGAKSMLSLPCLRYLELEYPSCLIRLAQVENGHQAAHLFLMQASKEDKNCP